MAVAPRFASANSGSVSATGTFSASWAATPAVAGERMYAILTTISATAAPTTPTGWSVEKAFTGYSTFFGMAVYKKTAVGGETSLSGTLGTSTRWSLAVVILNGADAPAPAHTEASRVSPIPSTVNTLVFPQITPAYDKALLVEMSAIRYEGGSTPGSVTVSDTNWTKGVDPCTTNTTGAQVGAMIATRQRASGTSGVQSTASTASTSPNSLSSNVLLAFPATPVADPTATPTGWVEVRLFEKS